MVRRKSEFLKWTLVLVLVLCSSVVFSRPQDSSTTSFNTENAISTERLIRNDNVEESNNIENANTKSSMVDTSRDVKGKAPAIGDSIKIVANQLLERPLNKSSEAPLVPDTRIPPKLKNQLAQKHKIKTRNEDGVEPEENSHAGVAVPVSLEEIESDQLEVSKESSTSSEGISTWVLVSNPANSPTSTESTAIEDKKQKPNIGKNKTKRPQSNKISAKRPIIGSTNKSDLIASGSAINENVYNKIKDTVLSNVQKNKNPTTKTTTTSTTLSMTSEPLTTKKEIVTTKAPVSISGASKSKTNKKSNKNKQKVSSSTPESIISKDSEILPMEAKEQEIELEISTPATTTKKPKRTSSKQKTKTKKLKTTKPKLETTTVVTTQLKSGNKTKSTKLQKVKKPNESETGPFTTQIYNYLSREVMPSVGVGVIGLAGLLGIAGYFLYPFTGTPVRRTFEVDKKDDIYKHNAEEYANDGNGQPEEEMLGTVLAGMPVNSKEKYNPYSAQTTHINNRYPTKKDQDIRNRQVTSTYGTTSKYGQKYNVHYQQKTGLAHGATYPEYNNLHYNQHQYESRNSYTTEKPSHASSYSPYSVVEAIYTAPQIGPSAYNSDSSSSVVYGVKPSGDRDFKPVYPYETQYHTETTSSPITYPPTSMYLGSNSENIPSEIQNYEEGDADAESDISKFVVGNIPKEFSDSATPAVVPEHGPRKLRRRRNLRKKRSVVGSLEEILKAAKENRGNEIFISNEIDEGTPSKTSSLTNENNNNGSTGNKDVYTVLGISEDSKNTLPNMRNANNKTVIESVSTLPIHSKTEKAELSNEIEETTKAFKVYEVFNTAGESDKKHAMYESDTTETTTHLRNMNTETTTDNKYETTSTLPSIPALDMTTKKTIPTYTPDTITYPPSSSSGTGFFDFLKRLVEFKYRLGLSILQTTSENLNRYLRSLEDTQRLSKSH